MKKIILVSIVVVVILFFITDTNEVNNRQIVEQYPWQVTVLANGRTRVFGFILGESNLKEVDVILKSSPKMVLFESGEDLSLEAYYKNISLGGLIGSFIFTLDVTNEYMIKIKDASRKKEYAENKSYRYELDKPTADHSKSFVVKNLIYIPAVQLDEETIVKRFGEPSHKVKLKTKEEGWHYLYPKKGLDLIYKKEGKEVLQYIEPKQFNLLLEPLQQN